MSNAPWWLTAFWQGSVHNPELHLMLSSPWFLLLVFALGASVGSFLNVVMIRLPRGESIVSPPSHCMTCSAAIRWYDNIPVLSYLLLRGRCRNCHAKFSPAYAIIEAIVGLLALACFYHARTADPWLHLSRFLAEFTFVSLLVVLAGIDARTWILPNKILLPAIPILWSLALLTHKLTWLDASIGAVGGFGVIALVILVYGLVTGRLGMGWGDAKLMAALGAFLGWKALPIIIVLGSLQGLLVAVLMMILGKESKPSEKYLPLEESDSNENDQETSDGDPSFQETQDQSPHGENPENEEHEEDLAEQLAHPDSWRHVALPFGPFLALAAIETLFFQQRILDFWLS